MKRENRILAIVAFLSFFAGFIFRHDEIYKVTVNRLLVIVAVVAAYITWLYVRKKDSERRHCAILCSIMGFFTLAPMHAMSWFRLQENITDKVLYWGTIVLFLVLSAWCVFCIWMERGITENTVTLVIFAGFFIRLFYIVMTQAHLAQNDIGSLQDGNWGHLGYVYQILTTGRLPVDNPVINYQLYHPPLHHAIAAICIRIYSLFGINTSVWDEVLQILPLFYSTATLVFLNKIGLQFRCSPLGRFVVLGFAGFFPYSIFLGAALNNDPLATLFMIMCVYFTLKWYQDPTLKNILIMAVCIGCAMMTKLSGAMIAPAMAIAMLWRAWTDRKQWVKWVKQFACFGVVAFPLGLWYSVLQWIRFRMPFGYVPSLSQEVAQFIGMYNNLWDRFSGYGHALENLALQWGPAPDVDYNIPVSLVKYSVFGELVYYNRTQLTEILGTVVFWATAGMFILFVAAFSAWLFMRRDKMVYKVFFGSGIIIILFAYVKFCLEYPHVCTMSVRYVMTALYLGMLVLGIAVSGLQEKLAGKGIIAGRVFAVSVGCLTVFYMLSSALLYFHLEWMLY